MTDFKHQHEDVRLTSAEIGALWNTYMIESFVHHVFSYFLINVEDEDIKEILEVWRAETKDSLRLLEYTYKKNELPVPRGITSEDINLDAPRLFSDSFYITYTKNMARLALSSFSLSYSQCSRKDLREFFKGYINRLVVVNDKATELMLSKGFYVHPPRIPVPKEVDFVKRKSFLSGFFGDKRPLTVLEITNLFYNAQANALGKAVLTGFIQVVKSKEIREFLLRGKELANKYFNDFTDILLDEDVTVPSSYDGEVTDSTVSPFSDRLMLFHITSLISSGLGNYGMAISQSPRRDLGVLYAKIIAEVGTYAADGGKLMIKNGWLEQPPTAPDRDSLSKEKKKK